MFNRPKPKDTILKEIFEAIQRVERRQNIEFAELENGLVRVASELSRQESILEQILADLSPEAQSAALTILIDGRQSMPAVFTRGVNTSAVAAFQEFDGANGTGNPLPPVGAVTFASDNAAIATVDPSSGAITVGATDGTCNISASDAGNGLSASDTFTVQTPVTTAQSATLVISVT